MRRHVHAALLRLRELTRRSHIEAEQEEEFRFHLEMQMESNRRKGMNESEARRAALLAFGGTERFREQTRDARGIITFENVLRDARFAVRRLRRSPGFSLGVVATLGVGTAAAMAIGTLVYGVLLRPLPLADPHELVDLAFRTPGLDGGREHAHSEASYVHFRDGARSFSAIGAYHVNDAVNLTDGENPQRVTAVMMTPGTLTALRVVPVLGRVFSETDAQESGTIPVLISHDLWRQRYAADSTIIGRLIEINRRPRRVVGVLPIGFDFPVPAARVWFPLDVQVGRAALDSRYLNVIARLRDGASGRDAEAELQTLIRRIPERFPTVTSADVERSGARADVRSLRDSIVAPVRQHLHMLGLTMIFVLLIATANVTNLFLLRSERLRHEIAITTALGGGSLALARRFITEGAILGAAGGVVALPIVAAALTSKFGFTTREIPRLHEITLNSSVVLILFGMALLLGAFVGLLAFTRARTARLPEGLRNSTRTTTGGGWRTVQQGLVATQIAVALSLLLSAGLMGRTLWNLYQVDLGFAPAQRSTFEVTLPFGGYETYAQTAVFHAQVLDRLRAMPGIAAAEAALEIPLIAQNPGELTVEFDAVGTANASQRAATNIVTPEYFRLMGIPLLHGRSFMAGDLRASMPAIVISASLARTLFGEADAVGRIVRPPWPGDDDMLFHVAGVVGDVPRWRIEDGPASMAYFPLLRDGDGVPPDSLATMRIPRGVRYVFRSDIPVAQLAPAIRAAVRELDSRVPVTNFTSLPAMVDAATARVRLTMLLLALAAAAALLLGVIGIYSVVSYTVAGRQREFGVRVALGATPSRIQRMVLREGTIVVAIGVAGGIVSALWVARFAHSMLYGVRPGEPLLYVSITLLLVMMTTAATLLPARRAARLDPMEVMRGE